MGIHLGGSSAFFRYMVLNIVALISTSSALVWNIIIFVPLKRYKAAILSLGGFFLSSSSSKKHTREHASDNYDP